MQLTSCPVCGNKDIPEVIEAKDYLVSRETFTICECKICTLRFTNPRPNEEDLASYYQSEDYVSHTNEGNTLVNRIYKVARYFTLGNKERLIAKTARSKSLLDIGCGTGHFLEHAQKKGWTINGVEVDEGARAIASQNTSTEIHPSLEGIVQEKYEVITLWHVLEHLSDLHRSIKKISSLLTENGAIYIAVPNYLSHEANKFKEHWAAYDVPRHLYHFSQESMRVLAKKNGLKIVNTIPMKLDSFYISLLSNQQRFGSSKYFNSFLTGLLSNVYAQKSKNYSSLIYQIQKSDK